MRFTRDDVISALASNKAALIAARRNGDDNTAATLSQEKELLKRQVKRFCDCGSMKVASTIRCPLCNLELYGRSMPGRFSKRRPRKLSR